MIAPDLAAIPGFLTNLPRWLVWRNESRGGKQTKVPKTARNTAATSTSPDTWASFDAIADVIRRQPRLFDGPGIVLGDLGNGEHLCGIDLDSCLNDEGALADWAEPFGVCLPTFGEVSPSERGLKFFFRCRADDARTVRAAFGIPDKAWGCKRSIGTNGANHGPGVEIYLGPGRFFTVTGKQWPLAPDEVALLDHATLLRLAKLVPKPSGERHGAGSGADSSRSAIAFRKGAALRRQGKTFEQMCAALRVDPETAEWCREKGEADDGRELRRIWERAAPAEPDSQVDRLIAEFNAKFFVLNEHGKAVIYAPRHDPIMNRKYYDRMSFEDFEKLYCNRFIQIGVEKDGTPTRRRVAPVWLNHSDRRQYIGGVIFDPSEREIAPDVLNLWRGFAVTPREGDWSKLRQHILDVICNYDQALYEYLLDWMADLVQNPAKQGEVAVVLRGPEGSGKGILARAVKYLFGQHGLAISNAKHLIGNFNGHLRDAVFLFADEAFYAGDKQHVGVLKALITEPYLTIEGKYQNAVQMPNFLHVMMASNEEWVVPASLGSRRWLVIDVQGNKIHARDYFGAIQKQLDDGGHAAMLYDLLNRDLSKSNLRAVPVTDALQTQRKMSLDTTHRWWIDCLHRGYVFQSRLGLEDHFGEWCSFLTTELLYASYSRYCTEARERHPLSRELFGRWMVSSGAKPARRHKQAVGEHMVDATTTDGRTSRIAEPVIHPFPTGYNLGDLADARDAFSFATELRVDWGGEEEG